MRWFIGLGIMCCMAVAPAAHAACCFGSICVDDFDEVLCGLSGGEYSDGDCAADPCGNVGVCCYPGGCQPFDEFTCIVEFNGDFIPQGTCADCSGGGGGACCLGGGACMALFVDDCVNMGGNWQGQGVGCDLVLCAVGCSDDARGDSNCDGVVNFDDITCFVSALISEAAWQGCGDVSACDFVCANDTTFDQQVNFDDIDGFIICLINGACPPGA